jgi:D-3-phosphoglycerate dehydrogenase
LRTADLLQCLQQGKISGAALDVLENEKLETLTQAQKENFEQLTQHPHVLLTPHIAGWTHESKKKIAEVLLQKIRKLYQE